MSRHRAILAFSILAAGPLLASLAWLWSDGSSSGPAELALLQARFAIAAPRARPTASRPSLVFSPLLARPLFQAAQLGAIPAEPSLRLEGVAKVSGRTAALIKIGDQAPQWLEIGQSHAGVTLKSIAGDTVSVVTIGGLHALKLGANSTPTATSVAPMRPPGAALAPQPR